MTQEAKTYNKTHKLTDIPKTRPRLRWDDFFFQVLMFFQRSANWPTWKVAASLLFWAVLIYGLWQLAVPGYGLKVSVAILIFILSDWLLLAWLPRAKRSFGPVNPQLMFMLIPRLLVVIPAAALAYFSNPQWGVLSFLVLEMLGSLSYLWGLAIEPQHLTISQITVLTPHLPANAEPIRLLHLSDFHVERLTRREEKILATIDSLRPDLIVITGDYLNASNRSEARAVVQVRQLLSQLSARHGVYAVLGTPAVDLPYIAPLHFQESDIQLLRRDVVEVDCGAGRRVALLGLDCTHDVDHDGQLLQPLVEAAPTETPRILLYHSPELMPQARNLDLDLYLCGHTHGGQVRIPGYGALFTSSATGKRYEMGRYDEHGTTLYVSRGIGLEGHSMPRLRLFCPPEITLVTLRG